MPNIAIPQLPFYWRLVSRAEKANSQVASHFPFVFDTDSELGLVIERRDPQVLAALETIYKTSHNIGYLQDANEIARPYGVDFVRYLGEVLGAHSSVERILEIGCGGCVVLADLKARGYDVLGIDSSPFAAHEGSKKGVDVITDFFPSEKVAGLYDMIFHVDVLEHTSDPVSFLKQQFDKLNEGGLVVVNVPDATESIEIGDISMAMHQHLNYFTVASLARTLQAAGLEVLSVDKARYGGSLYAVGRRGKAPAPAHSVPSSYSASDDFGAKARRVIANMSRVLESITASDSSTLGYYVPLRSLPYIALSKPHAFRFFDDTEHWHRREFDGVDVPVENFSDLKANPVSHIVIMSLTFAEAIRRKVHAEFGDSIKTLTLAEIAAGAQP